MTIEMGQMLNPDTDMFTINGNVGPDTEYTLPNGVVAFWLQSRNGIDMWLAFVAGRITASKYVTIPGSVLQSFQPIRVSNGSILYLRSSAGATDDVEIITWIR